MKSLARFVKIEEREVLMKVIWALDAFEDNENINHKLAEHCRFLHARTQASIQPVYLLRENEVIIPTYEVPTWITEHSQTAEEVIRQIIKDYNLPFMEPVKIIPHAAQSHAGAADVLSTYALKTGADMILVGSHGREGMKRFFLGSFAESLILQSEVPVCIIGSQINQLSPVRNILFPTDFGDHSKDNFRHVMQIARELTAEITLLHAIARPIESLYEMETRPQFYSYNGKMLSLEQIVEHEIEAMTKKAKSWTDWAFREGLQAQYYIDTSYKGIDEVVLEAASRFETQLIVMEAQSGPISAALLGSSTRNVTRKAPCPVYVITRHFYDKEKFAEESPRELSP